VVLVASPQADNTNVTSRENIPSQLSRRICDIRDIFVSSFYEPGG
jgi:hypothetical protein